MISGNPAVVWVEGSGESRTLYYSRALDAEGQAWGTPRVVATGQGIEVTPQLRPVLTRPAICYVEVYNQIQAVKFIRANDEAGLSWDTAAVVAPLKERAVCAMEIINGIPSIAFSLTSGSSRVYYCRAANAEGTAWGAVRDVCKGEGVKMAEIQGRPAILSRDLLNFVYTRAADDEGTSWDPPEKVAEVNNAPSFSLAQVEGNPAVAFCGATRFTRGLFYVRGTAASGGLWSPPLYLDANEYDYGSGRCAMTLVEGKPALVYTSPRSVVPGGVRYVEAMDKEGAEWKPVREIFPDLSGGVDVSMLMVKGRPAVFTYRPAGGRIDFLHAVEADAADPWPPALEVKGESFGRLENGGTVNFGNLVEGVAFPVVFHMRNINPDGNALAVRGFTFEGPDAAEFSVSSTPQEFIPAGANGNFTLECTPIKPGLKTVTLRIATNASVSPFSRGH